MLRTVFKKRLLDNNYQAKWLYKTENGQTVVYQAVVLDAQHLIVAVISEVEPNQMQIKDKLSALVLKLIFEYAQTSITQRCSNSKLIMKLSSNDFDILSQVPFNVVKSDDKVVILKLTDTQIFMLRHLKRRMLHYQALYRKAGFDYHT